MSNEKQKQKEERKREQNQERISKLVDKGAIKITAKNKNLLSPSQLKNMKQLKKNKI